MGEGVEIAKNGGENGKREFQELFKYVIRFDIALLVAAIFNNRDAPILAIFWYNRPTCRTPNFSNLT